MSKKSYLDYKTLRLVKEVLDETSRFVEQHLTGIVSDVIKDLQGRVEFAGSYMIIWMLELMAEKERLREN